MIVNFVRYCMFEILILITIRHLKWHHYACVMGTAMTTQRNTLSLLVNCEVAFISHFCDKLLCSYIFMQI